MAHDDCTAGGDGRHWASDCPLYLGVFGDNMQSFARIHGAMRCSVVESSKNIQGATNMHQCKCLGTPGFLILPCFIGKMLDSMRALSRQYQWTIHLSFATGRCGSNYGRALCFPCPASQTIAALHKVWQFEKMHPKMKCAVPSYPSKHTYPGGASPCERQGDQCCEHGYLTKEKSCPI